MKKIDKSTKIALQYHKWLQEDEKPPMKYDSSNNQYYKDVLVNLLCCQGGLCAYTEYRLIDQNIFQQLLKYFDNNGKYYGDKPEADVDIEHFCSEAKKINGWDWGNLFAAYMGINRIKRVREAEIRNETGEGVKSYLKPDNEDYSPDKYLEYDYKENIFYPSEILEDDIAEDVANMIYVLGLNWGSIKMWRKNYICPKIEMFKAGNEEELDQFHTAYEMVKKNLIERSRTKGASNISSQIIANAK